MKTKRHDFDLLIIEDDREILHLLTQTFRELHLKVASTEGIEEAGAWLADHCPKIILADYNLPDGNGLDFLVEQRKTGVQSIPILMTGQMDIAIAIAAINRGQVFRFVCKPLDLIALCASVRLAIELFAAQKTREQLTREVLEQNRSLRQVAEEKEANLRQQARLISHETEKVQRQEAHINELQLEIQHAYLRTVSALIAAMEAKDRYTRGHSERVHYYCALMADVLNLSPKSREDLHLASLLHDLGKIGIPDAILQKDGPLTADEFRVIARHPIVSDDILHPLPFLKNVRKIIREHHEHFDGRGYPNKLAGHRISLEGRILSVADAYDAMRSDRAYRRALPQNEALLRIKMGAGSQFCPVCSEALIQAIAIRGESDSIEFLGKNLLSEESKIKLLPIKKVPINYINI